MGDFRQIEQNKQRFLSAESLTLPGVSIFGQSLAVRLDSKVPCGLPTFNISPSLAGWT